MDSWFFNKIAGAVLSALLVAFGAGTIAEIMHHGDKKAKPGYELPVVAAAAGGAAAPVAFSFATVAPLLKSASAESGREGFNKCRACHTTDKDGKALPAGPNLYGVVGRNVASSAWPGYSPAIKGMTGPWTWEKLATFINAPSATVPGTKMSFAGVKNDAELADILAFLRSQADSPAPLPN